MVVDSSYIPAKVVTFIKSLRSVAEGMGLKNGVKNLKENSFGVLSVRH